MNPTQFMSRNLIFNTEFQNFIIPGNFQKFPGTLDIALELASFDWFQHMGYVSHSFLVKELDFQCRIWKLHHSWKLPEISWNSGYCPGNFQEWCNFQILHWKSSFLTRIEWKIYPIYWNQSKLANSRSISRVPGNFWKFPGMK